MSNVLKITIPVVILGVLAGGYLVISKMTDRKAEQRLQKIVDDSGLTDVVSWESVSTGPFNETLTVNKFKLAVDLADEEEAELVVEEVEIKNRHNSADHEAADIYFNKVAIVNYAGALGKNSYDEKLFNNFKAVTGLDGVPAYDLHLHWDYKPQGGHLTFEINTKVPTIAESGLQIQLTGVDDFRKIYTENNAEFGIGSLVSTGPVEEEVMNILLQSKLKHLSFNFKDQGFLKKYNAHILKQYTDAYGASAQQQQYMVKEMRTALLRECEHNVADIYAKYKAACATFVGTITGTKAGFVLAADAERPLSVASLANTQINTDELKQFIEGLTITVTSL
ncbi:MAG: hypothetical protein H9917_12440 [Candidatus Oceanisphaera merdipullorum]|nr:hypothetical protein [Candidatus Oceanisphaera merdipullorum]